MGLPYGIQVDPEKPETLLRAVRKLWETNGWNEDTGDYDKHIAVRLANEDFEKNGRQWSKCMDCGFPFMIGLFGADGHFCSSSCRDDTIEYMADAYVPVGEDDLGPDVVADGDSRLEDYE